jgi:hypothetical protein
MDTLLRRTKHRCKFCVCYKTEANVWTARKGDGEEVAIPDKDVMAFLVDRQPTGRYEA